MEKKKSLGQHFLHNWHHLGKIADALQVEPGEQVLEIGPGDGALTEVLLERGARVLAIEKDHRLIPLLAEKFAGKNFEVIEADALEFNAAHHFKRKSFKVVGNIPYYITGALLKKFLGADTQPSSLVFLIQKEVAERIARSKKESILSLSVKVYGEPRYVAAVPAGAFVPPPKVDSAILALYSISKKNFKNKKHEEYFFNLIKKGFSSKRKFLLNNLGREYTNTLENVGVSEKARAEDLSLAQWLALSLN